jgi:23S rRNA-/tRNA-specific pseudouridylate synthase
MCSLSSLAVRQAFPNAELPHRLDRITAGVAVVATSKKDLVFHNSAIASRSWRKLYVARLSGSRKDLADNRLLGVHKAYLKEGKGNKRAASIVRSGGKPSSLEVLHVEQGPTKDTLDAVIELHTGRYHQIRVMMGHLGVPLAGDELYGAAKSRSPIVLTHAALALPLPLGEDGCTNAVIRSDHLVDPNLRVPAMSNEIEEKVTQAGRDFVNELRSETTTLINFP